VILIAKVLQTHGPHPRTEKFSEEQIKQIQQLKFIDHIPLPNSRYYDRIWNVDSKQVERFYFNINGKVERSEVIKLTDDRFWKPAQILAKYFKEFNHFPPGNTIVLPIVESEIQLKIKG